MSEMRSLQHIATYRTTLQRTAPQCTTLRHTTRHCNSLQFTATQCNTLHHTATHCNTLQHTATHCNTNTSIKAGARFVSHDHVGSEIAIVWGVAKCIDQLLRTATRSVVNHAFVRVWCDSFICVTWFIHMCDMTHSYVWHDSFISVTWLIHMCDMIHSYVWQVSWPCWKWNSDRMRRSQMCGLAAVPRDALCCQPLIF